MPKAIVLCECSGIMVKALEQVGFDTFSVDLKPAETGSFKHIQDDALNWLDYEADFLVAMPECRYLCLSGVRWLYRGPAKPDPAISYGPERWKKMFEAARFFKSILFNSKAKFKAVENSQMHSYAIDIIGQSPTCSVQAWEHGSPEKKGAFFWTSESLKPIEATEILPSEERIPSCHFASPGPLRSVERARTNPAIAKAVAETWGKQILQKSLEGAA